MVLDFIFLFIFILVLVIIFIQFNLISGAVKKLNFDNFIIFLCFIFTMPGIFILYFQIDDYHREYLKINQKEIVFQMLLINSLSLISFLFGILFVRRLLGLKLANFNRESILDNSKNQNIAIKFSVLVVSSSLIVYLSRLDSIAIFELISNGPLSAAISRSSMTNSFEGSYFLYAAFFQEMAFTFFIISSLVLCFL